MFQPIPGIINCHTDFMYYCTAAISAYRNTGRMDMSTIIYCRRKGCVYYK